MHPGRDVAQKEALSRSAFEFPIVSRKMNFFRVVAGSSAQDVLLKITDAIYLGEDDWSQVFKIIPNKMLKNHPLKPRQPIRMLFSYWESISKVVSKAMEIQFKICLKLQSCHCSSLCWHSMPGRERVRRTRSRIPSFPSTILLKTSRP